MAKFSKATWKPVKNYTKDGQEQVLGVVVHIMAGYLDGSEAWFNNPKSQASSHFGTGRQGQKLRQWVDTKDRAWAQGSGNRTYISVENEGFGGDSLTPGQIEDNAQILAWAHKTHGVPLQLAKKVGDKGLAYHALGGAAWGGHSSCPGSKIVAQLPQIVLRAKEIVGAKPPTPAPAYAPYPGASFFRLGQKHDLITQMGKALVKAGYKGYKVGPGREFTRADIKAVAWFQRKQGWIGADADGYPGPETWKRLKVASPKK